ncbi:cell division protein ZapE [Palleronia marisminoris]|uniref:AFG1-like ATPase n=1 Tax=Palleronia marisminoris TaxID=315423 RepID=A0A1Y5T0Q3_9RHOB|nr:cell division protein ZapE [Palleronia marisminoris]SFH09525.1 cell division protein ZapE [Palleronia marisminoris]SLN52567.1 AFG1-like ATPase [Palleronia marisminoris]
MERFEDIYAEEVAAGRIEADPAQEAVLPEFTRLSQALAEKPARRGFFGRKTSEPVQGLYLWGGVGRGKSMLMDLFARRVEVAGGQRRVHFHGFMQETHAAIGRARKRGVDDAIKPVADDIADGLRLLCLDEMQIGDITDAMIVGRLFERLFEQGVTVVTTSNRPPDDLYKDGLNRNLFLPFIDLLKQRMKVVELASPRDWRQDRIAGADLYFTPADARAREGIDALWERLTGGAEPETLRLEVTGRTVELPRYAAGVVRAGFWDLCGRPLGAADYLALAEHVRVLMLENVPRLGADNYNEAKRFVTLIDALYEAETRLVMSAADRPEGLYAEGTGAFEFERTASRLHEMQSEGWGAEQA